VSQLLEASSLRVLIRQCECLGLAIHHLLGPTPCLLLPLFICVPIVTEPFSPAVAYSLGAVDPLPIRQGLELWMCGVSEMVIIGSG
jgi:hypothetical protein